MGGAYKKIGRHGFVGLQGLTSKKRARRVFDWIDDNGGGVILLDEWCDFLKACELASVTALGDLLGAEEDNSLELKKRAVLQMQCWVRRRIASRRVAELIGEKRRRAAAKMQALVRRRRAAKAYMAKRSACFTIQRLLRR